MKKLLTLALALCCALTMEAQKIVFVPQWTAQSQFAGYYVALEKGFYADEGLDVEITHIGTQSSENILSKLISGNAQIVGQQLLQAIIARADGRKIVNIMQLTQESGLCCAFHNPVSDPRQMDSLKVGRWKVGFSDFCDILESYNNIHVDWVPFLYGINLFIYGAVDATLCYSFSELIALELAIGKIPEDRILRFSNFGYECPEDGLYVTEEYYNKNKDAVDKFVRASKKGWDYARENRKEALEISMKYVGENNISTNTEHQRLMLDEYLKLQVNPSTGMPDYAPVAPDVFKNVVSALLNTGYIVKEVDYNDLIK